MKVLWVVRSIIDRLTCAIGLGVQKTAVQFSKIFVWKTLIVVAFVSWSPLIGIPLFTK